MMLSQYIQWFTENIMGEASKKQTQFKANFRRDDGLGCGRIEIAAVAALLRNDIGGLFEKTKPIQSQIKPILVSPQNTRGLKIHRQFD